MEYGAVEVDEKRPYGNRNVEHDIAELLNIETVETSDGEYVLTAESGVICREAHQITLDVVQKLFTPENAPKLLALIQST